MLNLDKYKLFLWVSRPYGIAREFYYLKSIYDAGMKFFIIIPEDNRVVGSYYFDKPSYYKVLEKFYERALKNYKQHLRDYPKNKQKIINSSEILSTSINKISDKKLFSLYKDYTDSIYSFFDYVFLPFALIEYTEPELQQFFPDDFDTIINASKPTAYQLMEKALLEEDIKKVWQDYAWLNSYYIGEDGYTLDELEKMKSQLDKEEIYKNFTDFEKHKKDFDQFLSTIKDEGVRAKVILLHEYTFLRNDRLDSWKYAMNLAGGFFEYLQSKFDDVSLKAIANLTYEEIEDILVNQKLPNEAELKKRHDNMIYYYNGKIHVITDEVKINKIKKQLKQKNISADKIKGVKASPGFIRARVVIINSNKELHKVKKGDVLVAKGTDPRFTPYMRIASAIVTDEGGMLSHAAITSRELKIPCIIGTKIATQVLQDGDMVEVDANNGVVKKID